MTEDARVCSVVLAKLRQFHIVAIQTLKSTHQLSRISRPITLYEYDAIPYDSRFYFNVHSKADN